MTPRWVCAILHTVIVLGVRDSSYGDRAGGGMFALEAAGGFLVTRMYLAFAVYTAVGGVITVSGVSMFFDWGRDR